METEREETIEADWGKVGTRRSRMKTSKLQKCAGMSMEIVRNQEKQKDVDYITAAKTLVEL